VATCFSFFLPSVHRLSFAYHACISADTRDFRIHVSQTVLVASIVVASGKMDKTIFLVLRTK